MSQYPTDPAGVVAFIGNIADLLRKEGARVVALEEFFRAGDTQTAADALGSYIEGHMAAAVRGAVVEAIALACMKACDAAGPDRYTIPTARSLLGVPANLDAVVAKGGDRTILGHFIRLADEIASDHSFARLRELRNYSLAHHLPEKYAAVEKAKILHLWNAVDDVVITIDNLVAGTGRATVTLNAADRSVWRERSEAYWRRLIEGPPGRQATRGGPTSPSG